MLCSGLCLTEAAAASGSLSLPLCLRPPFLPSRTLHKRSGPRWPGPVRACTAFDAPPISWATKRESPNDSALTEGLVVDLPLAEIPRNLRRFSCV